MERFAWRSQRKRVISPQHGYKRRLRGCYTRLVHAVLLLRTPTLILDRQPLAVTRRKSRASLYYLAAHHHPLTRKQLLAFFWRDLDRPAAPHGLAKPGPDTSGLFGTINFQHYSGYFAEDDRIRGFSQVHLHGTGATDYGVLSLTG